ncbi:hypothetical protein P7K49_024387 [Saguinus oedipus]|uniref:Uncharacterized protein n=1 Tax=Saguinus oedipus TaxID=9490 RepID=A0ABQ9UPF1_SAGOE|nr:hypothetical protein P7K49_024387 [Saguinus oedipus]
MWPSWLASPPSLLKLWSSAGSESGLRAGPAGSKDGEGRGGGTPSSCGTGNSTSSRLPSSRAALALGARPPLPGGAERLLLQSPKTLCRRKAGGSGGGSGGGAHSEAAALHAPLEATWRVRPQEATATGAYSWPQVRKRPPPGVRQVSGEHGRAGPTLRRGREVPQPLGRGSSTAPPPAAGLQSRLMVEEVPLGVWM